MDGLLFNFYSRSLFQRLLFILALSNTFTAKSCKNNNSICWFTWNFTTVSLINEYHETSGYQLLPVNTGIGQTGSPIR